MAGDSELGNMCFKCPHIPKRGVRHIPMRFTDPAQWTGTAAVRTRNVKGTGWRENLFDRDACTVSWCCFLPQPSEKPLENSSQKVGWFAGKETGHLISWPNACWAADTQRLPMMLWEYSGKETIGLLYLRVQEFSEDGGSGKSVGAACKLGRRMVAGASVYLEICPGPSGLHRMLLVLSHPKDTLAWWSKGTQGCTDDGSWEVLWKVRQGASPLSGIGGVRRLPWRTLKNQERSLVKGQASIWRSPGELQRTLAASDPFSVFFDLLPSSKPEGAGWRGWGEGVVMIGKKDTRRTTEWASLFLFSIISSESGSSWALEELWSGWKIEVWTVVTV